MDNREAGRYDPDISKHPPACTCAECVARRLGRASRSISFNLGKVSLFGRPKTKKDVRQSPKMADRTKKPAKRSLGWLLAMVLVFACALIGLGIWLLIGTTIPLWLLLGFSIIFSTERWFHFITARRNKTLGKLYRLLLNLSMLALLGIVIWTGIRLFSQQFTQSQIAGSIVFFAEVGFFIWIWRVVSKNRWRFPSMKLTVFSLIAVSIVLAFAGVQPVATFKDEAVGRITDFVNEQKTKAEERAAQKRTAEEERLASLGVSNPSEVVDEIATNKELRIGLEVLETVNAIRKERGSPELLWDDKLYEYSLAHSKNMAREGRMFHSDINLPYGENAWWGGGSTWGAEDIVESWMTSPKHRTWLLCPHLRHVAVGVAYSSNDMYASWTFWRSETTQSDWWYQYMPDNPPEWWY